MMDIFLTEAYVTEKLPGISPDSQAVVKRSFYAPILKHHKVDSAEFYATFYYFQRHPLEMQALLKRIDSAVLAIRPGDTTTIVAAPVPVPENINTLSGFSEQERAMREEFLKQRRNTRKNKPENDPGIAK